MVRAISNKIVPYPKGPLINIVMEVILLTTMLIRTDILTFLQEFILTRVNHTHMTGKLII